MREAAAVNHFERTRDLGLRVQMFRYAEPVAYPDHVHAETSIVVCTRGSLESSQFGVRTILRPGEILLTNRNTTHASRYCFDGEPSEGVTIDLDEATAQKLKGMNSGRGMVDVRRTRIFGSVGSERLHRLAQDLRREIGGEQAGKQLIVESMAVQLCVEVLRMWPSELVRPAEGLGGGPETVLPRWQFIRAIEQMYRHDRPRVDWERVALAMDADPVWLAKRFEETTGSRPQRCYEQILAQRVMARLSGGKQSKASVLRDFGFRDATQFRRMMKRIGAI